MNNNSNGGIRLHNRFTISNGQKIVSVHNEVLDNLLSAIMDITPYATHLAFGSGTTRNGYALGVPYGVKTTRLGEHNFNSQNGTLFATYYITITDDDMPPSTIISEVGLSAYADGSTIVNYVTFDSLEKIGGQDIIIKVEMVVEQKASETQFISGENLFVKALLGNDSLYGRTFQLGQGLNDHPNMPIYRSSTSNISQKVSATIALNGNDIKITGAFSSSPVEVIVLMDEVPVMRAHFISGWKTNSYTGTVLDSKSVDLVVRNISYVTSMTTTVDEVSTPISDYAMLSYPEYATADSMSIMDWKVEKGARFLHEPTGTYIAVCGEKSVTVYNLSNRKVNRLYVVERYGEFCALCTDGSLFMAGNGQLVGYMFKSGVAKKQVFEGYSPYEVAVVKEGTTYLIASRDTTGVDFLTYDGTTLTLNERVEMPGTGFMCRVNQWYIAICNKSPLVVRAKGLKGENERVVSTLTTNLKSSSVTLRNLNDAFMELYHPSMDRISVQHVEGTSKIYMTANTAEYPMTCEEIITVSEGDALKQISFTSGAERSRLNLYFDGNFGAPIDIANLGDYLLFLYEDCVKTVYLTNRGIRLYFPYLTSGSTISYNAIVGTTPSPVGGTLNTSITIRLG